MKRPPAGEISGMNLPFGLGPVTVTVIVAVVVLGLFELIFKRKSIRSRFDRARKHMDDVVPDPEHPSRHPESKVFWDEFH